MLQTTINKIEMAGWPKPKQQFGVCLWASGERARFNFKCLSNTETALRGASFSASQRHINIHSLVEFFTACVHP